MTTEGRACAGVTGHGDKQVTNENQPGTYSRFRAPFKEFLKTPLARRRVAEQLRRAAIFIERGNITNFETAMVVAGEWLQEVRR
jgi:hypothetical protein